MTCAYFILYLPGGLGFFLFLGPCLFALLFPLRHMGWDGMAKICLGHDPNGSLLPGPDVVPVARAPVFGDFFFVFLSSSM